MKQIRGRNKETNKGGEREKEKNNIHSKEEVRWEMKRIDCLKFGADESVWM